MTDNCGYFEKRGIKTQSEADWRMAHNPHLLDREVFSRERHEHPSVEMYWLVCSCGARLLCMKKAEGR